MLPSAATSTSPVGISRLSVASSCPLIKLKDCQLIALWDCYGRQEARQQLVWQWDKAKAPLATLARLHCSEQGILKINHWKRGASVSHRFLPSRGKYMCMNSWPAFSIDHLVFKVKEQKVPFKKHSWTKPGGNKVGVLLTHGLPNRLPNQLLSIAISGLFASWT